ncbi:hypothetical protein [Flavobacterium sp. FlaQc-48]|uniref:hypothetical protein n=1 Tax=Flavobacterium sp. FlaQc-48 TaxID=3374181 RepID=UPI00375708C9
MKFIRNLIEQELQKIEQQLSSDSSDDITQNVSNKKELKKCLFLIDLAEDYDLDNRTIKEIISLPDMKTGYSEYRIINDCESDAMEDWVEIFDDHTKRLLPGDLIILKK